MTFEIDKTEYIAIVAGIDSLPPANKGEVIAPAFVELAQKTAMEHLPIDFLICFRRTEPSTNFSLKTAPYKNNSPNGNLTLSSFGICICSL